MENVQSWEGRYGVMGIAEGGDSEWESGDDIIMTGPEDEKELFEHFGGKVDLMGEVARVGMGRERRRPGGGAWGEDIGEEVGRHHPRSHNVKGCTCHSGTGKHGPHSETSMNNIGQK